MTTALLIPVCLLLAALVAALVTLPMRLQNRPAQQPQDPTERSRVVVHTRDRVSIRGWETNGAPRTPVVVLFDAEYLEAKPSHTVGTVEIPADNVGWIQHVTTTEPAS